MRRFGFALFVFFLYIPYGSTDPRSHAGDQPAYLAILIDDLGHNLAEANAFFQLPIEVGCAILPHMRYSALLAVRAHKQKRDILLHQPMEPAQIDKDAGPGKLTTNMTALEVDLTVKVNLETVPYAIGINNHMGSLLTSSDSDMDLFMGSMARRYPNFLFIDSLTAPESVAHAWARSHGIPYVRRDVFLDHIADKNEVHRRLDEALNIAKKKGFALAIGHPYPETLSVLTERLTNLPQHVKLIPLGDIVKYSQREIRHAERTRAAGTGL